MLLWFSIDPDPEAQEVTDQDGVLHLRIDRGRVTIRQREEEITLDRTQAQTFAASLNRWLTDDSPSA